MADQLTRVTAALTGRYEVERELGAGGMATVYLATDVKHARKVAVKVLRPDLAAVVGPERFLREIEIAAQLQHPHILPLYDSGAAAQPDGGAEFLYYVMPYVEGESLSDKVAREGALPIAEATRIVREVADALAYAHDLGVVHRDIKPDNVMLTRNHALVADFGIAKAVRAAAEDDALTATGMAIGTPAYMAPEQAAADPHADHRADLYALGVMAYEVLTGRPPFNAPTAQAMLAAHLTETPDPVTRYRPSIPEPVAALVMRCLEKLPADRVQTADEVLQGLESVDTTSGGTTPVAVAPPLAVATRPVANPIRVAAMYAGASVAVLAIVYGLVLALGLPGWVNAFAVVLIVIGFPIMLMTSHVEGGGEGAGSASTWFTWRRALLGGAIAFGSLGLVTAGYMGMRAFGVGPIGTLMATGMVGEGDQIILADFVDRSGDSTLSYAVTEAFRVDLSQSSSVSMVPNATLEEAFLRMERPMPDVMTLELAREVAVREGIKAVVAGEINEVGGSFVISAQFIAAETGDVLLPIRETASDSSRIIAAVDKLSNKLRERIGESLRTIRQSPPLERVTTSSLPALRLYSQASRASDDAEPARAVALFKEAIALDSTFAAAHRGLAILTGNWGIERDLSTSSMAAAYRFRDRLTDSERLWTTGTYHMRRNEVPEALVPYLELLEREPDRATLINNIGVLYSLNRESERSLEYYKRAWELDPGSPEANFNVVVTFLDLGLIDSARAAAARFADLRPDHPIVPVHDFFVAVVEQDYTAASTAIDTWAPHVDASSAALLTGLRMQIAATQGRPSDMLDALRAGETNALQGRQVAEHWQNIVNGALYEATVRGRPDTAVAQLERALSMFPLDSLAAFDRPYVELAEAYARAGRPDRARELIAAFDREVSEESKPVAVVEYHRARGFTALVAGDLDAAVQEFQRADVLSCKTCVLPALAQVYDQRGQDDLVLAALEQYVNQPEDDRGLVDAIDLPGALVRLGELYEAQNDRAKAVEYYSRFTDLWAAADPEFQSLVDDVRGRIARLVAEGN